MSPYKSLMALISLSVADWDANLPPLSCVQNVINNHFKNKAVTILVGKEAYMDEPFTNTIIKAIMKNKVYQPNIPADTIYGPDVQQVQYDVIYLYSYHIAAGEAASRRRYLIIHNQNAKLTSLNQRLQTHKMFHAVAFTGRVAHNWTPYDPQTCWSDLIPLKTLGFCDEIDTFFQKLPETFQGCPLRSLKSAENRTSCKPHSNRFQPSDGNYAEEETFFEMVKRLNLTVVFETEEEQDERKGDGMQVDDIEVNCILNGISPSAWVESTLPYSTDQIQWFVAPPRPAPLLYGLYSGLKFTTWCAILASIVSFNLVYYIMKRNTGLQNVLIKTSAVFLQQCITSIDWFLFIFMVFSLLIAQIYQVSLLRNLFKVKTVANYETLEEALNDGGHFSLGGDELTTELNDYFSNKYESHYEGDVEKFLLTSDEDMENALNKLVNYRDGHECLLTPQCILARPVQLLLWQRKENYVQWNKKILENEWKNTQYVFEMRQGHPLLPLVNQQIRKITEAGIIDRCQRSQNHIFMLNSQYSKSTHHKPLTIYHLQSIFYVWATILTISVIVFICEKIKS